MRACIRARKSRANLHKHIFVPCFALFKATFTSRNCLHANNMFRTFSITSAMVRTSVGRTRSRTRLSRVFCTYRDNNRSVPLRGFFSPFSLRGLCLRSGANEHFRFDFVVYSIRTTISISVQISRFFLLFFLCFSLSHIGDPVQRRNSVTS